MPTPPSKMHGMGITNAVFMGMRGGPAAAVHAQGRAGARRRRPVDAAELAAVEERLFAPLRRADGVSPRDVIARIQDALTPVDYSVVKTEERMREALDMVLATADDVQQLRAGDLHELTRCVDAQSMALEAELFYRASLERTESRGFHLREDFPERDDDRWLKWVVVKKDGDGMALRTEDIPLATYPYQPPRADG